MAKIEVEERKRGRSDRNRSVDDIFFGGEDEEEDDFDDLFDDDEDDFDDFDDDDDFDDEEDDDSADAAEDESPAFVRRGATASSRAPQPSMPGSGRGQRQDPPARGHASLSDEALMEADLAEAEGRTRDVVVDEDAPDDGDGGVTPDIRDPWTSHFAGMRSKPRQGGPRGEAKRRDRQPVEEPEPEDAGEEEVSYVDETEQLPVPRWVVSIDSKLNGNVAHAFLLEGNIRDYMVRNISIKDGIIMTLDPGQDSFEVIASYDQAHGLTFDTYSMEGNRIPPSEYRARFIDMMHETQMRLGVDRTEDIPRDPVELFSIISKIVEMPGEPSADGDEIDRAKLLLFVDYPEMLIPQSAGTPRESERQLAIIINDMCRSELADQSGCCIIMMTDDASALSERVRSTSSRVDRVNVPMPLLEARKDFIYNVLSVPENSLSDGRSIFDHEDMGGVGEDYLAINTAGLAAFQIEDIVLRALADDMPITPDLIKERKNEIIMADYNEILEIMEPKYGFKEIGGMQQIKEFFTQEVIEPIHRGELEGVPMGVLLMGPPGTAKPISNSTKIYRLAADMHPQLTTFGELSVGDYVYNCYGGPTRVLAVKPRGVMEAYEVVLKDGRKIVCSRDHVWGTYKLSEKFLHERTVDDMLREGLFDNSDGRISRARFYVPMNPYVQFPAASLSIDPYVLGCFLGDGCCTEKALTMSSADTELVEEIRRLIGSPEAIKRQGSYSWVFRASEEMCTEIRAWRAAQGLRGTILQNIPTKFFFRNHPELLGNSHQKRIPPEYKLASYEQRLALIQGLLDTDGSIVKDERYQCRGNVSFSSANLELIEDVREVLFSLGIGSTLTQSDRRGEIRVKAGKEYARKSIEYRININCPNAIKPFLFRLSRKVARAERVKDIVKGHDYTHVPIVDIRKLDDPVEMTCITVDGPYGLFLAGKDFVVCHNTLLSKAVAKESGMNCVNLNLNRILSKYVGGSEHNLDRALDCAMAMEPTIIFIDEIDEALPKRNGMDQTGISQRINKRLLEFMSNTEHRGQVMILAATNYPEKIDPAFKRAGRFDNRLPMFAPGQYDRARILHISAAKARYTISSFLSPDTPMTNPFRHLREWLPTHANGLNLSDTIYDMTDFEYPIRDHRGNVTSMASIRIPTRLYTIMQRGNKPITLEEFYRTFEILVREEDMPRRGGIGIGMLSTQDYRTTLENAVRQILVDDYGLVDGNDPRWVSMMARALVHKNEYFDPFGALTTGKTGAELDVVINKCISIYRKWKITHKERYEQMLANGEISGARDIPWFIVLEACEKTTSAVSGIKTMEDFALIDTSDTDYIPDEEYGIMQSATPISYRDRQAQLLTRMRSLAGDDSAAAMEKLHQT